ncbi:MAG TPA: hypothetical protein DD391_02440 [Clostridiales bacterium]|nr:HlyD family efflux transporter periplasmic adaptor subunit [Clostridiales bacterium]HBL81449.1 hypothetical protein [Clostridiales bacterium]
MKLKANLKKFRPKKWMVVTAVIVIICVAVGIFFSAFRKNKAKDAMSQLSNESSVSRQSIVSSITGTAVVKPKDQYSITSLVNGDILSANFEQGDMVNEGDVLYRIDASDAENSIESANIAVERSQNNYSKAVADQSDLTVKSDVSGIIKKLYIKKGDSVNAGAQIADIYDDSVLLLTIPFNESDIPQLFHGANATVRISGTSDTLFGTVKEIKGASYAKAGNMLVRDVVIRVENPGTLMVTDTAVASIGSISCNDSGTFEYVTEKTVTAKASGDVSKLYVSEGGKVKAGGTIAQLSSDTVSENIKSNALSLKESQLSKKNAQKKLEDYTITAPISGTVVEKNVKAGDKLDNSNASTVMAVIYDMPSLEFELAVDELDIKNVALDQDVTITSDALENKTYHGKVTNVSVSGTTENGVTTYPVTVEILDFDDQLLPGMNIDVEIETSRAENVLSVPVAAVNRGNTVYVKGEKTDENDRAPEGFKTVKVETGVYNDELIEVTSGLSEGDVVYVPQQASKAFSMEDMMGGMGGPGGMTMDGPSGGMGGGPSGGGSSGGGSGSGRSGGAGGGGMR